MKFELRSANATSQVRTHASTVNENIQLKIRKNAQAKSRTRALKDNEDIQTIKSRKHAPGIERALARLTSNMKRCVSLSDVDAHISGQSTAWHGQAHTSQSYSHASAHVEAHVV